MPPDQDRLLLLRSVELSEQHMQAGEGGPFGSVIADADGSIVAEGWNEVLATNDPTAHAEMVAIRRATSRLGTFDLTGYTIYASCEPCPMCLAAILWARLDRLVFANGREDAARIGFDDAVIYEEVAKPLDQRLISCEQIELDEAAAVFDAWIEKPDKVPY